MTNTSILEYLGARNSFLTTNLKNNHDINGIFKMAALNLHIGKGNCACCSYKDIIIITVF